MGRTTRYEPISHQPKTRDILLSILSEVQWLSLLKGNNRRYEALIIYLEEYTAKSNEDMPLPSIKAIATESSEKPSIITKWIAEIYNDLIKLNEEKPDSFMSGKYQVYLRFTNSIYQKTLLFTLWLDHIPVVGQRFEWQFVAAYLDSRYFYVYDVSYEIKHGRMETTLTLKSGFYNSYREFLIDKSLFLGLIDLNDTFRLTEYELDNVLRKNVDSGKSFSIEYEGPKRFRKDWN